ncbi:uncharacterized protein LOC112057440 [Bicyclus anynana]|uniref:Uncharacterized protein LOC112057440 n=1 Tax=Bicyclus anynana TaxID=110368 RepID=A0ABM3LYI3_BICAN|nr:uncharacterized protein LOC112057440 [Bicyclus anynana]
MAEESISQYLRDNNFDEYHKILKINKVTKQVVSGYIYTLDFDAYPTKRILKNKKKTAKCKVLGKTKYLKCKSKIWEQPWLNKKEIDVKCEKKIQEPDSKPPIVGGKVEQDINDPIYEQLAKESFNVYNEKIGSTVVGTELIVVTRVTKQVVSGTSTEIDFEVQPASSDSILLCNSKIWEQPWLNKREIDVKCEKKIQEPDSKPPIVGGKVEQDINDPIYEQLAKESFNVYNEKIGSTVVGTELIVVTRVTKQVVSGTSTEIDFEVQSASSDSILLCNSKIWEQPWLNKKEIDVKCEKKNQEPDSKPPIVGGKVEQDINDPIYEQLAKESFNVYNEKIGSTVVGTELIVVTRVTKQVVSGTSTEIDFEVQPASSDSILLCNSKIWEQPWLNKREIDVKCEKKIQEPDSKPPIVGGKVEQDINDPIYEQLAKESFNVYNEKIGSTVVGTELIVVTRVTKQVVSGTSTEMDFEVQPASSDSILLCNSKIWEQPWLNKKEIDVKCEKKNQEPDSKPPIVGGKVEQDINDPIYEQLAKESFNVYNEKIGSTVVGTELIVVTRVTKQVVSGTSTEIDFEVQPASSDSILLCNSKIWEQPWLNKKEIDVKCEKKNQEPDSKPPIVGGKVEQDINDPIYEQLAKESFNVYNEKIGSTVVGTELIVVTRVTKQVVSGTSTEIDFEVQPASSDSILLCNSKIWEQPWLNKKEIDVKCEKKNQEPDSKPPIVGGKVEQDINDPIYEQLAKESFNVYNEKIGSTVVGTELIVVTRVTKQVVSGTSTEMDFEVQPASSDSILLCNSKIWEQPWLNKKEIDVKCEKKNQEPDSKPPIVGGKVEQDINDPIYEQLAKESFNVYNEKIGSTVVGTELIVVTRVTKQVVSGTSTEIDFEVQPASSDSILLCNSKIWEQPWLNRKEIDVNCYCMG